MKKIIFLTVLMIMQFKFSGVAQQVIKSNMLSMQFPVTANHPTKDKLAIAQRKFHHSNINEYNKNILQIDDILITYQDNYFDKTTRQTLESTKKQMVSLTKKFSKNTVITDTSITTINNVRMLIIKSHTDNDYFFRAYTDLYKNTSTSTIVGATDTIVGGTTILVQCTKDDEVKATRIFNDILKSVALKE